MDSYYRFWGKARPASSGDAAYHALVYHSLDVAAVARVLLKHYPALRSRLARLTGLSETTAAAWLVFFLSLHDIGKFAEAFQAQQKQLFLELRGWASRKTLPHPARQPGLCFVGRRALAGGLAGRLARIRGCRGC